MAMQPGEQPETSGEIELAESANHAPLPARQLRWRCDPAALPFRSTDEVEPIAGIIGQDAAVDALRFGLEIHAPGQNVFVRGLTGTGRQTLVKRVLEEIQPACPLARDRCYVHNFAHPDRPRLITLPRGQAHHFRRHIEQFVEFIRGSLEGSLASEGLQSRRSALDQQTQQRIDAIIKPFEESLKEAGLGLVSVKIADPAGGTYAAQPVLLPLVEGKPTSPEEWEKLRTAGKVTDKDVDRFTEQQKTFQPQLREIVVKMNEIRREHGDAVRALRSQAVRTILRPLEVRIKSDFPDSGVRAFLDEMVDQAASGGGPTDGDNGEPDRRFQVNVLISREPDESCAILVEHTPTLTNLLGTIDHMPDRSGPSRSDHLMVNAGSLLRADGGYLILDARDLVRESGAWKVLIRSLRTGCLEIVPPEFAASWWAPNLKPEAIDLDVKVILLGDAETYYVLDAHDPDFPHLFKVLADFDSVIPRSDESIAKYGGVLARIAKEENLATFQDSAVAVLVEHAARIAGRQHRLTSRFGRLADIAREASYVTRKAGRDAVTGDDVRSAIRRSKQRGQLPSKRFHELLADGTIIISTTGSAVGQVNGLAVTHAGPLTYGFPARITATIGPGSAGVINIEGESNLSGSVHTKGFHILGGLLRYILRTDHPLTFHAAIALEQSYGGIDGDSASGAEICCLLSALTDIPLRQDLAMTGAIDQVGHIMAIGGVNEKIEGFFDTCRDVGLSGTQGVIIPKANACDLMLREDVVEACEQGRFHVYTVSTVHEALELLTGVQAGGHVDGRSRGFDLGEYPENTLLGVAVGRAFEYWVKAVQGLEIMQDAQPEITDAEEESADGHGPPAGP